MYSSRTAWSPPSIQYRATFRQYAPSSSSVPSEPPYTLSRSSVASDLANRLRSPDARIAAARHRPKSVTRSSGGRNLLSARHAMFPGRQDRGARWSLGGPLAFQTPASRRQGHCASVHMSDQTPRHFHLTPVGGRSGHCLRDCDWSLPEKSNRKLTVSFSLHRGKPVPSALAVEFALPSCPTRDSTRPRAHPSSWATLSGSGFLRAAISGSVREASSGCGQNSARVDIEAGRPSGIR